MTTEPVETYEPRTVRYHGTHAPDRWRLKVYSVSHDGSEIDWPSFAPGLGMAMSALPNPAVVPGRPGAGLVIVHHGRGADYVVAGWWDRGNELPLRVFVRAQEDAAPWRAARGSESVCVWDLELIGFERDAYVNAMMVGERSSLDAYLRRHCGSIAESADDRFPRQPSPRAHSGARGAQVEYREGLPESAGYFELFGTTGWNALYDADASELSDGLERSWYAIGAYEAGRLVGFGRLLSDGVLYAVVFDMIVAPDRQRRGIGTAILRRLLERCDRAGIRDVLLFSASGTVPFYEKFGFRRRPDPAPGMIRRRARS